MSQSTPGRRPSTSRPICPGRHAPAPAGASPSLGPRPCEANDTPRAIHAVNAHQAVTQTRARLKTSGGRGDPLMDDQDLDARLAASRARSLGNIRRAREAILKQMRENERLAMRGAFEEVFHRRLEDERRELEDLAEAGSGARGPTQARRYGLTRSCPAPPAGRCMTAFPLAGPHYHSVIASGHEGAPRVR